jgi:hypothetical protein
MKTTMKSLTRLGAAAALSIAAMTAVAAPASAAISVGIGIGVPGPGPVHHGGRWCYYHPRACGAYGPGPGPAFVVGNFYQGRGWWDGHAWYHDRVWGRGHWHYR